MSKIPYISKERIKKAQDEFLAGLKKEPEALKEYQEEQEEMERLDKEYKEMIKMKQERETP